MKIILLLPLLAVPAWSETTKLGQAAGDPMGAGMLPVVSMHDMQGGGRWGVSVSPFMWSTVDISRDGSCCTASGGNSNSFDNLPAMKGYGGAVGVNYEFSPRWGMVGFAAAAVSGKESLGSNVSGLAPRTAYTGTTSGAGFAGGELSGLGARTFGAMATYDHFADSKRFRMPFSLGMFYAWQTLDFDHSYRNPNDSVAQTDSVRFRRSFPGLAAALSFDFTIAERFRVSPGIFLCQGFAGQTATYDYKVERNGVTRSFAGELTASPGFGAVYLAGAYKPWGLGYNLVLVPGFARTSGLTFTKKFGA